jgi:hypothetical protein
MIHGEIYNTTSTTLYNPIIEVQINRIAFTDIDTGTTTLPAIFPGQAMSFHAFTGHTEGTRIVSSKVISWSTTNPEVYLQATVLDLQTQRNAPDLSLHITIRNDNAVPIYDVQGAAWSLPSYGSISSGPITGMLAPGETIQWTTVIEDCYECLNPRVVVQGTAHAPNP